MKHTFLIISFFIYQLVIGQQEPIKILNANQTYRNQKQYPGAIVLNGKVKVLHQGAILTCRKALLYQLENRMYAFGNVVINQADTLTQHSNHLQYDGNSGKSLSWGDVKVKDNDVLLVTDTLKFDRQKQVLKYDCSGTITNKETVMTSIVGEYYANEKKITARKQVHVKNPDMDLNTGHLDYYTQTGRSYLYGPSTIKNESSNIYTERGIYNTRLSLGYLLKNSIIYHDTNEIKGDSLFYDKNNDFASGTGNLVITDTVNSVVVKGDYGEVYRSKDSIIVNKKPVAISIVEQDSMFIHGDVLSVTSVENKKLMKIYNHVKFFKSDLSGKCDSLVSNQGSGITEMFKSPVLWSSENQITGDSILLLSDLKTSKLDSLKVIGNALIVQKDSTGYNQIKGRNMFGKFENQKLKTLLSKGNGAVINYARDDQQKLSAIMDMECSNIMFDFLEGKITTIKFLKKPDGKTYPPSEFPKEKSLLSGFIWREEEQPKKKEDIFKHD